jgi:hypothetical protein
MKPVCKNCGHRLSRDNIKFGEQARMHHKNGHGRKQDEKGNRIPGCDCKKPEASE